MLRVVYQAADLNPGELSDWYEDRGFVRFRVARGTRAHEFIPSLNETVKDFLANSQWFQLWEGEIVSARHPENPVSAVFAMSPFRPAPLVELREHKGLVTLYVSPTATIDEIAPILNTSIEELFAGGQWFQLWRGEIVTIDSPGSMAA